MTNGGRGGSDERDDDKFDDQFLIERDCDFP